MSKTVASIIAARIHLLVQVVGIKAGGTESMPIHEVPLARKRLERQVGMAAKIEYITDWPKNPVLADNGEQELDDEGNPRFDEKNQIGRLRPMALHQLREEWRRLEKKYRRIQVKKDIYVDVLAEVYPNIDEFAKKNRQILKEYMEHSGNDVFDLSEDQWRQIEDIAYPSSSSLAGLDPIQIPEGSLEPDEPEAKAEPEKTEDPHAKLREQLTIRIGHEIANQVMEVFVANGETVTPEMLLKAEIKGIDNKLDRAEAYCELIGEITAAPAVAD